MKRKAITHRKSAGLDPLIGEVRGLIQSARHAAATTVDTLQVLTNFEIGRRIVKFEQKGDARAPYGALLLKAVSARLTKEFGRGFSEDNLSLMRRFYLAYADRFPISETLSRKLLPGHVDAGTPTISETVSRKSASVAPAAFSPIKSLLRKGPRGGPLDPPRASAVGQSPPALTRLLSWSHYVLLLSIQDPDERRFYEIESASAGWALRELKRQMGACLYERLALSRDKAGVRRLAEKGHLVTRPEDILKDPYVLEFLGLDDKAGYSESDLETAIISQIERFLLELGKGFLFEARQKRFTFDEDHYFVDLVFYNRLLRCYVLIDLKLDKLTHQDLGQMQMYVNWFDRHEKQPDENPTIGIVLCKRKKDAIVELTLPKGANIHAREYKLYLPSKDLLKRKLLQWIREKSDKT